MQAFETIWAQIEETFNNEAKAVAEREIANYTKFIDAVLKSGKSPKDYTEEKFGKMAYCHEYSNDVQRYGMIVLDREKGSFVKSNNVDVEIEKLVNFYIDMLKWKLMGSVYKYLAGIDIVPGSIEMVRFTSFPKFSGNWTFTTTKGEQGSYETRTIIANGPIVREHYRYISHVFGKVNIDNTLRAKLMKEVAAKKPKLVFETKEEKEYNKRLEKLEATVKSAKWFIDFANNNNKTVEPKDQKRYDKAVAELEEFKATVTLTDIANDLDLKKDQKRIKEINDRLNYTYGKDDSELKILLRAELDALYIKRPEIKQGKIRLRVNYLKREIKYYTSLLNGFKKEAELDEDDIRYFRNCTKSLADLNEELKIVEPQLIS